MGLSRVYGLDRFKRYLSGMEDCYAIIGGVACDVLLSQADLDFRATKDIDLVLFVEQRFDAVGKAVWQLVKDGGYKIGKKSNGTPVFYRFTKPSNPDFPAMIELFSAAPDFLGSLTNITLAPLRINDELSSLSAIILDKEYHDFMRAGCKIVEGVSVLDETHMVPFKAKAFIDLKQRREQGQRVDSRDISKHQKDVFRLLQLFTANSQVVLPPSIKETMTLFYQISENADIPLHQIGVQLTKEDALTTLRNTYNL